MRSLIGAVVVLALSVTTVLGQEKIDPKKLIGKWEPISLTGALMVVEFTDKGKVNVSVEKGGKSVKIEGTYRLSGNNLEMALKINDTEQKETITVMKLTDEELVGKDEKGKEETLRKLKDKK